jgi:hypothetical protein
LGDIDVVTLALGEQRLLFCSGGHHSVRSNGLARHVRLKDTKARWVLLKVHDILVKAVDVCGRGFGRVHGHMADFAGIG